MPTIDQRTKAELIEQLKKMAPYYVSEWRFSPENPDPGTALALIFTHLLEGNIKRLNQVPYKTFLAFLNHLNVELAPAKPAMAQVTFSLTEGTPEPVWLDSGVPLAADVRGEDESIPFETVSPVLLTTAKLIDVISIHPLQDRIVELNEPESSLIGEDGTGNALFDPQGENLQEHAFYMRHDQLFYIKHPAFIEMTLFHSLNEDAATESARLLTDLERVSWEYFSGDEWRRFDRIYSRGPVIRLLKLNDHPFDRTECHGEEGVWIRCRANMAVQSGTSPLNKVQFDRILVKSEYAAATDESGIQPELLFFNDVQLDHKMAFLPFGEYFAPYGLFYIANDEAFSKHGANIQLRFDAELLPFRLLPDKPKEINWKPIMKREVLDAVELPDVVTIANLQWEYWNGRTWAILPMAPRARTMFSDVWEGRQEMELTFQCPDDIEPIVVNAEENYWIRARILQVNNAYSPDAVYYSPQIDRLRIRYGYEKPIHAPQQLLTYNNLELADRSVEVKSAGMPVKPFYSLEGSYPSVWLGFDAPPERGPISLYWEMKFRPWTDKEMLLIEWEYLKQVGNKAVWVSLQVADDTNGFARSGNIQFVGPRDFALQDHFGRSRYWIRAVCRDHRMARRQMQSPEAIRILLNTTLAVQQTTIVNELPRREEVIDRFTNEATDYYILANTPVLSEEVWVDETDELLPSEIEQLRQQGINLDIVRDSEDEIMRVWVQYEEVEQFLSSGPDDRHYRIDRATGTITFGDGKNGKQLPREGDDLVRVTYRSGGGKRGNVPQGSIQTLQNSIAFIDEVTNHYPAAGGCDIGEIEEAVLRGPKRLVHRNRAVIAEDFEWLAREAHPNIAKVKCLPNTNVKLEKEMGALTIVVLPKSGAGQGIDFQELKKTVEERILTKVSAAVAFPGKIQVIEPALLEIGVHATIWVRSMDDVVPVERELVRRLNEFLDPIHGYTTGKGWEIGQHVHPSMFYALMKSVGPIVHIPQLAIDVYKVENGERVEWNPNRIAQLQHSIVVPGTHRLIIEVHN